MLVGYARTSSADQKAGLDAQRRELKAVGCEKVFAEQVSSVAQRPKLAECLSFLREGDTLVCTKPDRLARSTAELLTIETDLAKHGVGLVIQSMGLDTRNGSNPTALERQREGIAKAKAATRAARHPSTLARSSACQPRWGRPQLPSSSASPVAASTGCLMRREGALSPGPLPALDAAHRRFWWRPHILSRLCNVCALAGCLATTQPGQ
jgi:hypothetical protein